MQLSHEIIFFIAFLLFIGVMLAVDLGLFSKKNEGITLKRAAIMSGIWVSFAILFYFILYLRGDFLHSISNTERLQEIVSHYNHPITILPDHFDISLELYNHNLAIEFITGYLVEYALSVDNIFVMLLIFTAFSVPQIYYHRVLFWGILGAVVLRFMFIFLGASLIQHFAWILYIFGAFLLYSGIKIFINRNEEESLDVDKHPVVKTLSKYFTIHPSFVEDNFFVKHNGKRALTPLFIVLIIIEFTDLIFAVDSIPAIFAVTKDPYIVFFSNIFAILGLRSMFFLLVNIVHKFHYLKIGLSFLLSFIGIKMLAHHYLEGIGFTNTHSLMMILLILCGSVLLSLLFPKKHKN